MLFFQRSETLNILQDECYLRNNSSLRSNASQTGLTRIELSKLLKTIFGMQKNRCSMLRAAVVLLVVAAVVPVKAGQLKCSNSCAATRSIAAALSPSVSLYLLGVRLKP